MFRERKIPEALQKVAWCFAIASGLCCVCIKGPWYRTSAPTTEFGKLCTAFFDRILWSVFLAWVTLACATGRGGFVASSLSWRALRPLSRLAFGMYIVHMPFMQFTLHISRERMFFSHFFISGRPRQGACGATALIRSASRGQRVLEVESKFSTEKRPKPLIFTSKYIHIEVFSDDHRHILLAHRTEVSFAMVVLTWGFLFTYLLYVYCEAPACRIIELLFRAREQAKGGVNIRSEKAHDIGRNKKLPPKRTQPNLGSAATNALNHH
ncbi:hypothetical protein HPB52_006917 [Rhipicephalus sanguineus]|uniref:Acyltransferase 3 domain-containing protein n=1 Tax=Rhipicephalus sanguineus TaxID=34632 RepID=A0A9D4QK15_RHISA|nr:hypothetical protein HPB52_006917 [Rhipicephalus sanguineus]